MPIDGWKAGAGLALVLLAHTSPTAWAGSADGAFLCHISHPPKARDQAARRLHVVDEFESADVVTERLHHYCNPASIEGSRILDPSVHFVTYLFEQIDPHAPVTGLVTHDYFGTVTMAAREPQLLMVPASGPDGVTAPANHYKCYRLDFDHFKNPLVHVEDAFTTPPKLVKVRKPRFLCNPADVDGKGIRLPASRLTCYRHVAKRPAPPDVPVRDLEVADGFGDYDLDAGKDDLLCVTTAVGEP